jgi:hypothetical protein
VTDADEAAGRDIALAIEAHLGLGLRTLLLPGDQDAMIHLWADLLADLVVMVVVN